MAPSAYHGRKKFCSKKCLYDRTKIKMTCEWCGNPFSVGPSKSKMARFCSLDCSRKVIPAQRLKTINSRYSKEEQREWAKAGGKALAENGAPWNKGKTKDTDERIAIQARGLIGHKPNPGSGRGKGGWRDDIQMYVRSTWEADVARIFNLLGIQFEYEPRVFEFRSPSGDVFDTFRPDFFLPRFNLWVEISSWLSPSKKLRLSLLSQQYPDINFFHVTVDVYSGLRTLFKDKIAQWEGKGRGVGNCQSLLALVA